MNKTCPSCGSNNVQSICTQKSIKVSQDISAEYLAVDDLCNDCGENGDFTAENDERIETAIQEAKEKMGKELTND